MKKNTWKYIMGMAAGAALVVLSGCGGTKKAVETEEEDTTEMAEETTAEAPEYYLTAEGIGLQGEDPIIKVGMSLADLPDAVEGLYQEYETENTPDYTAIIFRQTDADGNVTEPFQALDFGEKKVDMVQLRDRSVKVTNGELEITLMSPFSEVLALQGVKATWEGYDYDGEGTWYWIWHGLYFQPDQERLPESLVTKLYNSHSQPLASDFTEDVRIGMIATGLPF